VPRATIQIDPPDGAGTTATAVLIAAGDAAGIDEILTAQGLALAAFDSIEALIESEREASPELILLFGQDELASPTQQIEPLRRAFQEARIVVVCADMQRWEVRAALAAGAAGVVLEDDLHDALGPCLAAVRVGQICVPREHWRQIEPPALSTREKQILGLVVMGYMNSQIAERLFLAESTVKSHLSSAFGKLGVRSRNEAVNLILDSKRGLGMGILGLGGEPLEPTSTGVR
jgi:DNA-binding NarL/FixJ family response regulator